MFINYLKNKIGGFIFWFFAIYSIITLISSFHNSSNTWNLNRSIGWGWDFTNYVFWIGLFSSFPFVIYTLGYGFLYFRGRKPNLILSLTQIFLILGGFLVPIFYGFTDLLIGLLGIIIFLINMRFVCK